jgi:hypothetical protein
LSSPFFDSRPARELRDIPCPGARWFSAASMALGLLTTFTGETENWLTNQKLTQKKKAAMP